MHKAWLNGWITEKSKSSNDPHSPYLLDLFALTPYIINHHQTSGYYMPLYNTLIALVKLSCNLVTLNEVQGQTDHKLQSLMMFAIIQSLKEIGKNHLKAMQCKTHILRITFIKLSPFNINIFCNSLQEYIYLQIPFSMSCESASHALPASEYMLRVYIYNLFSKLNCIHISSTKPWKKTTGVNFYLVYII